MIIILYKNYTTAIACFKKLIKHLNVRDTINTIKMKLFNNYFNKYYKKIENVIEKKKNLLQKK